MVLTPLCNFQLKYLEYFCSHIKSNKTEKTQKSAKINEKHISDNTFLTASNRKVRKRNSATVSFDSLLLSDKNPYGSSCNPSQSYRTPYSDSELTERLATLMREGLQQSIKLYNSKTAV